MTSDTEQNLDAVAAELEGLLKALEVHEKRMEFLFDMIVSLRDKQTDPDLRESLNSMKYVLSGRPSTVHDVAVALPALLEERKRMREALEPFAKGANAFDEISPGGSGKPIPDSHTYCEGAEITVRDFRNARAAINTQER